MTLRVAKAIVVREWREWWPMVAAAPILGLIPVFVPEIGVASDAVQAHGATAVRHGIAFTLVSVVGVAMLGTLAAGLLVRDLAERRAGFYFSKPIPAPTLWLAKLVAGSTLIPATILGLVLPTALVDPLPFEDLGERQKPARAISALYDAYIVWDLDTHPSTVPVPIFVIGVFVAILLVLAIGHGVATALRSRDAWVLADLLGLSLIVGLLALSRDTLLAAQAQGPMVLAERAFFVAAACVVVVAGIAQLAVGRVDLRRGHAAFSITLWSGLLVVALGLWGYAAWAASPELDDLVRLDSSAVDPDGRWWLVSGTLRGRPGQLGTFLVDLDTAEPADTGEYIAGPLRRGLYTVSDDGSRLAWLRCARIAVARCSVWTRDLRAGTPARPTSIDLAGLRTRLLLSPYGDRLATITHDQISVHLMPSGELLGSVRSDWLDPVGFVGPDTIRYLKGGEDETEIVEFGPDPEAFDRPWTTRKMGRFQGTPDGAWALHAPADLLLHSRITPLLHRVRDASTGEVIVDLTSFLDDDQQILTSTFLDDATVVVAVTESDRDLGDPTDRSPFELLIVDPTSTRPPRWVELPAATTLHFGHEIAAGRLLVGLGTASPGARQVAHPRVGTSTVVVDVESGTVEPLVDGLLPLDSRSWDRTATLKPGSRATELFVDGGVHLVRFDRRSEPQILAGPYSVGF